MQTNDLLRQTVFEGPKLHDKTILTHRELIERDEKRASDRLVTQAMRAGSASQAVLGEFEW